MNENLELVLYTIYIEGYVSISMVKNKLKDKDIDDIDNCFKILENDGYINKSKIMIQNITYNSDLVCWETTDKGANYIVTTFDSNE